MYDQTKTMVLTGVAYQFVAQANHAEIHFYLIGPDGKLAKDKDGKNADWGVEMAGAAAMAQQGITAAAFPVGTIFSVKMNPLRDGSNFGSRVAQRHRQMPLENTARSRQDLRHREGQRDSRCNHVLDAVPETAQRSLPRPDHCDSEP